MQMATFKLATTATTSTTTTAPAIQHKVVLSWKASTSANVTGYNVCRSTILGGYYGVVGTTSGALSYTDATVASGTTYYYVITAVSNQGLDSSYSNQVVASVPSP